MNAKYAQLKYYVTLSYYLNTSKNTRPTLVNKNKNIPGHTNLCHLRGLQCPTKQFQLYAHFNVLNVPQVSLLGSVSQGITKPRTNEQHLQEMCQIT